ncbi:uncharacterized protein LOC132624292 [Lycium barbarum]|uniref:uncharacterized protein LOC132624292 n=1 Tax=Lycium barbarum TaxID=112863 RepID=UPI00293F02A9|nr:uncharacterized protein LOC132624292 [Lycium barbarum]
MGRNINEFKFISQNITSSGATNEAKDVYFERNITVSEEDVLLERKLNTEQKRAYHIVLDRFYSNKPGAFFIDGSGGTRKTFLYRALLAVVRKKGFIALATASSGVAASILPRGSTTHSHFKIPIVIDENFTCNISKQSSLAGLIRDSNLIVWDEVSMAKNKMIEAFDKLLKDLMSTNVLFGGKVVVFGGDFRQTLPVIRSGKKEIFSAKVYYTLIFGIIWKNYVYLKTCVQKKIQHFVNI